MYLKITIVLFCWYQTARALCLTMPCTGPLTTVVKMDSGFTRETPEIPFASIERRLNGETVAFVCKSKITSRQTDQSWMSQCDTHYVEKELYDSLRALYNGHAFAAVCRFDSLGNIDTNPVPCPNDGICVQWTSSPVSHHERVRATVLKQLKGDCLPMYTDSTFTFFHCDNSTTRPFWGKSVLAFFDSGNVFSTIRLANECSRESAIFLNGDSIALQNGSYFDSAHVSYQRFLGDIGMQSRIIGKISPALPGNIPFRIWDEKSSLHIESSKPIAKVCICQVNGRTLFQSHPSGATNLQISMPERGKGILCAEITFSNGTAQRFVLSGLRGELRSYDRL